MDYLFIYYGDYHIVTISDDEEEFADNIDHVIDIYRELFPEWGLVAYADDIKTTDEYYSYSFITFMEAWELLDDGKLFNPIFYEMEDGLLQKLINYYHTEYVMEEMEPDEAEAYKIIMTEGPKSIRKNIIFEPKGKTKKK